MKTAALIISGLIFGFFTFAIIREIKNAQVIEEDEGSLSEPSSYSLDEIIKTI